MAALPPLITADDLAEYGYDPAAAGKIPAASARVRRYTRQQITPGTSQTVLRGVGPWLLPQRPAHEITAALDRHGNAVAVDLAGQWVTSRRCAPITVTYTHGFDPLPDELIELVCAIASRLAAITPSMVAGARTEQAGGETVTWGADGFGGTTGLTSAERQSLDTLFPKYVATTHLI